MVKKLIWGSILARLAKIWVSKIFFVGFIYTKCYTLSQAIIACNFKANVRSKLKKMTKNHISDLIQAIRPKFGASIFFFKNLVSSVTRYHDRLSSCKISEKTNDPVFRKLSDRPKDGLTDRLTRVVSQDAVQLTPRVQQYTYAQLITPPHLLSIQTNYK